MVRHRAHALGGQSLGGLLHLGARQAVDDARLAVVARAQEGEQLPRRVGLRHHLVADVGTIEAGDEETGARQAQVLEDLAPRRLVGGRGERDARHPREAARQHVETAVLGTEVVAPLAHAVGLVDGEQRERRAVEQLEERLGQEPLGRHVDQVEASGGERALALARHRRRERRVDERGGDARFAQRFHLVLHQRDQRRDDDAGAGTDDRWDLVAQALAAAGGHQHQRVAAGDHVTDDLLLAAAKRRVAEHGLEHATRIAPVAGGALTRIASALAARLLRPAAPPATTGPASRDRRRAASRRPRPSGRRPRSSHSAMPTATAAVERIDRARRSGWSPGAGRRATERRAPPLPPGARDRRRRGTESSGSPSRSSTTRSRPGGRRLDQRVERRARAQREVEAGAGGGADRARVEGMRGLLEQHDAVDRERRRRAQRGAQVLGVAQRQEQREAGVLARGIPRRQRLDHDHGERRLDAERVDLLEQRRGSTRASRRPRRLEVAARARRRRPDRPGSRCAADAGASARRRCGGRTPAPGGDAARRGCAASARSSLTRGFAAEAISWTVAAVGRSRDVRARLSSRDPRARWRSGRSISHGSSARRIGAIGAMSAYSARIVTANSRHCRRIRLIVASMRVPAFRSSSRRRYGNQSSSPAPSMVDAGSPSSFAQLARLMDEVSRATSLDAVYQRAIAALREALRIERAAVLLLDRRGRHALRRLVRPLRRVPPSGRRPLAVAAGPA